MCSTKHFIGGNKLYYVTILNHKSQYNTFRIEVLVVKD